jgi:hypothetical protein
MNKRLTEEEKDRLSDYIHEVAKAVMNAMDKHMTEHIGHADPNVGANASALALAYCLAMSAPTNDDIDIFMSNATEQAKDVAKETRPAVLNAERLMSATKFPEDIQDALGTAMEGLLAGKTSKKDTVH